MNQELREWLNAQLAKAEQAVTARKQLEDSYRADHESLWEAIKANPNVRITTSTPRGFKALTKEQRLAEAEKHARIGNKCRKDVEHWKTLIALLEEKADPFHCRYCGAMKVKDCICGPSPV